MLALIAGTGKLPVVLHDRLAEEGHNFAVCAMHGFEPDIGKTIAFRLENLGVFLTQLADLGVQQVCLAGAVRRPQINPTLIDTETKPLVERLQAAMALGDDGTLREIIAIFEERGFAVVGASLIAPDLLPEEGVPTLAAPTTQSKSDAALGQQIVARMGEADTGQACIIKGNNVLAEEGPDGTDAMIRPFLPSQDSALNLGPLDFFDDVVSSAADWLSGKAGNATGGILFKGPKPKQDRRVDLPVIGPETARLATSAGLAGIVIEANGVMVLDFEEVVQILDDAGLFLWVRP